MPTNPTWTKRWSHTAMLVVAGMLCLPFVATPTYAQDVVGSPLPIGAPAQIVYANGQDVLLRAAPGYDQMVLNGYAEGTPVEIIEGPLTAADGSTWFGVLVSGEQGYLAADFLATGDAPQPVADAASAPAGNPVADGAQEQPAALAPAVSTAYATSDLNLRLGPSPEDTILLVIPGGAALSTTGEASNGFLGVVYDGQTGWADGAYVGTGVPVTDPTLAATDPAPAGFTGTQEVTAAQPADSATLVTDPAAAPSGTSASVLSLVNLRGGPSESDAILRVLPAGSPVTVTGAESNGFVPVWYNGTTGWIAAPLIDGSGLTTLDTTAQPPAAETAAASGSRTTAEPVNIRAEPAVASRVIGVIPGGVALTPLAGPESGFYQVAYDGVTGWVSGASLGDSGVTAAGAQPTSAYAPGPGLEPTEGGSGLIWPVASGGWTIMQGYNGSSHQDRDSNWQYYYSLDLVRSDGATAGQQVLAPTAGTVRWLDPSTGGISIDIGNGHAVAMFHISVDPSLRDGDPVRQGQAIGHISGPGEAGFAGTPHVHFSLWQTTDGGNWSRDAVPFTGAYALAGREFPDIGGSNQYRGTEIIV